jgi:phage gpG-like protein
MVNVDDIIKKLEALKKDLPQIVGTEAVTFFKQSFRNGGFTDNALVRWQKGYKTNGAILVKAGHLRDSIEIISLRTNAVVVGSVGIRYAKLHNEGGVLQLTAKQRKYFWAKYYELVGKNRTAKGKARTGVGATLRNSQADAYKRMALAKTLKFPKRQFIGQSAELNRRIAKMLTKKINEIFNHE